MTVEDIQRSKRKIREGSVISSAMEKTAVVLLEELKPHSLYKKVVRHRSKVKVHDERNECSVGDRVRIMEVRPISKDKRWRVVRILEKVQ